MPTPTDGTPMDDTWRLELEMFCGTETFRCHQDIKWIGTGSAVPPSTGLAIINDIKDWFQAMWFPDVTLNNVFLRHIYRYTTPPPHVVHPPIWTITAALSGAADTTYGGGHFAGFLPQQVCIYAQKSTTGGRKGKVFMRNILTEADVQSTIGGVWAFSPHPGGFQQTVFDSATLSTLGKGCVGGVDSVDYVFAVTHLEHVAITDVRPIYSTPQLALTCVRPTWNDTSR